MTLLYIDYADHQEGACYNSLQAAELIAINAIRQDNSIECIHVVDNKTGAIIKTFTRE